MNSTFAHAPETRKTAWVLYMAGIAIYSVMYIPQPFLPAIASEFGISPVIAALSISVGVAAIALASSLYGPLAETRGVKRVMVTSCFMLAIPTLLCAIAPTFPIFLSLRAMQGFLLPGVASVAIAYIGTRYPAERVGRVVGNYIGATVVGGMSGRVISGFIASLIGWRASFGFFAVTTLLTAIIMARSLPTEAQQLSASGGLRSAFAGMWQHLGNRALFGGFAIGACTFFAFIAVFTYLPFVLVGPPYELPQSVISSAYVVYAAGVLASPIAGRLATRFTRRSIMASGMIIAAAGCVITLLPSLAAMMIGLLLLCVGMFTTVSSAPSYVNLTATTAKSGAGALYLAFYYVGATLGSFLPGLAWQARGWPGVVVCAFLALAFGLLSDWRFCQDAYSVV